MSMHALIRRAGLAALLLGATHLVAAATWPNLLNYQGQLTDSSGNAVPDGPYSVLFSLYTVSSGGTAIWSETQPAVNVSKGLFNAVLGSTTPLPAAGPPNFYYSSGDLYLGVKVGADPEMTPRQQLLPGAYARNAQTLGGLLPNNTASNLVVLDATGKIPAGLVQAGSLSAPFDLTGSSASYDLNLLNSSASPTAVGLTVVASNAVVAQASSGIGVSATTASASNPAIFASAAYPLRLLVGNGAPGNLGLQAGTPNDDMDANLVDRSRQAAVYAASTGAGAVGVSATASQASGVLGVSSASDPAQGGVVGLNTGAGQGVIGVGLTGVAGVSVGATGIGVSGINNSTTDGAGYGVIGLDNQNTGFGMAAINTGASGIGLMGRHGGTGAGIGVRGQSKNGTGAVGVYGVVSGTGSVGVSGFSGNQNGLTVGNAGVGVQGAAAAPDGFGVVGTQAYTGSAQYLAPNAAGIYGKTTQGLGVGTGVRGEGSQGVIGVANGACGLCGYNYGTCPTCYGAYVEGANQGVYVNVTGASGAQFAVTGNINSNATGSAAGTFQASGSGQTYGLNVNNDSASGIALNATGGNLALRASSLAGGTNYYSDNTYNPAFGFYHSAGAPPAGSTGVYAAQPCADCFGGYFTNETAQSTAGPNGNGAALKVDGRMQIVGSSGVLWAPNTSSSVQLSNKYLVPTSMVLFTPLSATASQVSISNRAGGSCTVTFSPALTGDAGFQYLVLDINQ